MLKIPVYNIEKMGTNEKNTDWKILTFRAFSDKIKL